MFTMGSRTIPPVLLPPSVPLGSGISLNEPWVSAIKWEPWCGAHMEGVATEFIFIFTTVIFGGLKF